MIKPICCIAVLLGFITLTLQIQAQVGPTHVALKWSSTDASRPILYSVVDGCSAA